MNDYRKMIFKCLPTTLFIWMMCACSKNNVSYLPVINDTSPSSPAGTNPITYLALGDSYTIGQSVDSADRYPAQAAAMLSNDSIAVPHIQYIAATGWTTSNLQAAISTENPQGPFTAVTLLIGVNDQYQTRDTTGYRGRFANLLNTAIALAGNNKHHVFVLSIPDYGITPFGANYSNASEQIDAFNAINKDVTAMYGVAYVDVTAISRNDAGDNTMLAPDGLHPSGKQYTQWAAILAPVMEKALR